MVFSRTIPPKCFSPFRILSSLGCFFLRQSVEASLARTSIAHLLFLQVSLPARTRRIRLRNSFSAIGPFRSLFDADPHFHSSRSCALKHRGLAAL